MSDGKPATMPVFAEDSGTYLGVRYMFYRCNKHGFLPADRWSQEHIDKEIRACLACQLDNLRRERLQNVQPESA